MIALARNAMQDLIEIEHGKDVQPRVASYLRPHDILVHIARQRRAGEIFRTLDEVKKRYPHLWRRADELFHLQGTYTVDRAGFDHVYPRSCLLTLPPNVKRTDYHHFGPEVTERLRGLYATGESIIVPRLIREYRSSFYAAILRSTGSVGEGMDFSKRPRQPKGGLETALLLAGIDPDEEKKEIIAYRRTVEQELWNIKLKKGKSLSEEEVLILRKVVPEASRSPESFVATVLCELERINQGWQEKPEEASMQKRIWDREVLQGLRVHFPQEGFTNMGEGDFMDLPLESLDARVEKALRILYARKESGIMHELQEGFKKERRTGRYQALREKFQTPWDALAAYFGLKGIDFASIPEEQAYQNIEPLAEYMGLSLQDFCGLAVTIALPLSIRAERKTAFIHDVNARKVATAIEHAYLKYADLRAG